MTAQCVDNTTKTIYSNEKIGNSDINNMHMDSAVWKNLCASSFKSSFTTPAILNSLKNTIQNDQGDVPLICFCFFAAPFT